MRRRTQSVLHYELSEYLPAVNPHKARPEPPRRPRPQAADPEYAPQEIVVTMRTTSAPGKPSSSRARSFPEAGCAFAQPGGTTQIPGAPMAMNHPLQVLPVNTPQIAPPAQPVAQSRFVRCSFRRPPSRKWLRPPEHRPTGMPSSIAAGGRNRGSAGPGCHGAQAGSSSASRTGAADKWPRRLLTLQPATLFRRCRRPWQRPRLRSLLRQPPAGI